MARDVEISPFGSLLVFKTGYTPEFVLNTIKELNLKGLRIFAHLKEDRLANLDFIKDYTFLETLDISSVDDYDFTFLLALYQLKDLTIVCEGNNAIQLSSQINLESLTLKWRKAIKGIEFCEKLIELVLIEYCEFNLLPLGRLRKLREIVVKTASIKSLMGIGDLGSLERIALGNCRTLRSIKFLNGLEKLKSIELESCTKIEDYESLAQLPSLEELTIIDCKGIKSIKFIKNFPLLDKLSILGNTDILDGDLFPAQNIKKVVVSPRRHYNIKM
jgi:hypothetical protein